MAEDPLAAGRLLRNYAFDLCHESADYASAVNAFDQAVAIARREGDTALEAQLNEGLNHDLLPSAYKPAAGGLICYRALEGVRVSGVRTPERPSVSASSRSANLERCPRNWPPEHRFGQRSILFLRGVLQT